MIVFASIFIFQNLMMQVPILPSTETVLDKSKSLFGNSVVLSEPVQGSTSENKEETEEASSMSEHVENLVDNSSPLLPERPVSPDCGAAEEHESMDQGEPQNLEDMEQPNDESFEKKTISMDTSAAAGGVHEPDASESPETKMDEEDVNGDDDKVDTNDEALAGEAVEDKTDEEIDEEEEEEEIPKKKAKRAVVDDDEDKSEEQGSEASVADEADVSDTEIAKNSVSKEESSGATPGEPSDQNGAHVVSTPNGSPAPIVDDDAEQEQPENHLDGGDEIVADESTEEAQTTEVEEAQGTLDETNNGNVEHGSGANTTVDDEEPTTPARSSRSRRKSAVTPNPDASATKRSGRGRQSLAKGNDGSSQDTETPVRRGRSAKTANSAEQESEVSETPKTHERSRLSTAKNEDPETVAEDNVDGDQPEAETPKRGGRGKRSMPSTQTPRSTRGRGKKTDVGEDESNQSAIPNDKESEDGSSTRTPRTRKSTSRAAVEQEVVDETDVADTESSEPTTSSRRSTRTKASAKATPATPATNKRTPARGRKKEASITEQMDEDAAESTETPSAKRGGKRKIAPSSSSKKDDHDPYDIDTEMEHHPEPLKNIQMEVQSFGSVKYAKTGESSSKYSMTEKAAESRVADLQTSPTEKNRRSLADMTPGKEKQKRAAPGTGGRKSRAKKEETQVNEVEMDEAPESNSNDTANTSNRSRKRKSDLSELQPPSAKRDQHVEVKVLDDEQQLLVDHPQDENEPHAPGARVYAIFQKTFYPAVILSERDGLGRYKLQFTADKVVKDVPNSGIIPLRALVAGKTASLGDDEVRLDSGPNDISAEEWTKGILKITVLDSEGEPTEVRKDVDWKEVSFDQIEWKDYVKNLEQNATAIMKSNITTISEATRRKSTFVSQLSKPRSRKKKDDEVASSRGVSESPIDEDETLPMKPEAIGKNIFAGKVFMLTSANRSEQGKNVPPMLRKKNLMAFIANNGGIVTEKLNENDGSHEQLLISDTYYRTHKYLAALARGTPCVSTSWLQACAEKGECIDYADYVLPAGASIFDDCRDMPAPKNPSELLKGITIYVHSTHSVREVTQAGLGGTFVEIWKPILELLGATVVDADWQTLRESKLMFDVALVDGTFREEVMEYASEINAKRVTSEWVIQTIILSRAPDAAGHPKFDPYRLHHRTRH
ncbi:hypothetical protein B9Z55_001424 [Caenorhabditis nigoni]|uniref:BRCT domain-containing protein n=1 Tax=Caenorhabditis nigoni TaxID=1611254 RepID=A0A2G5VFM6_9PELO|nr:hypothetical protein B9Z55_001424 [Caenorhabditis nigoni]